MDEALLTIKEAVIFTGKCERTIYRYIKKGKIPCQTVVSQMSDSSQTIVRMKKSDLIRVFNIPSDTCQTDVRQESDSSQTPVRDFKEDIKTVIEEYFNNKSTQLMKPLEEQALYRCGILENEVKHLQAEKETLRQENEVLREQVKALPDFQKENDEIRRELSKFNEEKKSNEELRRTLDELQQNLTKLDEEKKQIAEAWRKKLEEARRPWYRKLFS